ncbi:ricin-type beta-trefoil lectin domain protein [Vibrio hippocampi]|uniref:Ricin B lectin domain-containing protein n=1 Tax=Vibrio hippocampi TaxID=654686 RepID=A0ABM8ZN20_9VIBR|nr:ricin-type beta-trefoil lectin domain protein [Vibrio hippocampi]CAH0529930.1 hypothetical protein VHP8226_03672 [Vibrio hippocampi]
MKYRLVVYVLLGLGAAPLAHADNVEIALKHNLDGFLSGYCLDIVGSGSRAALEKGLQSHTCYSYRGDLGIDQVFDSGKFVDNQLYLPQFKVCAQLSEIAVGATVGLSQCDNSELQQIKFAEDGTLRPVKDNLLCLTAGLATKRGRGGTSDHQIKTLTLQSCSEQRQIFQQWYGRTQA